MASEEEIANTVAAAQEAVRKAVSKKLAEQVPSIVQN